MADQTSLQELWLGGKAGCLCAREQLKAWALREAWRQKNTGVQGMLTWIAERLVKNGGGQPTNVSVKQFLDKIDEDDDWFPGKQYGEKRGRKRVLTGAKALAIERCAKAHKAKGGEVTYAHVVGTCKDAVKNPATGKPMDKRAVYTVFQERCYDDEEDPSNTWTNTARLARTALPKEMKVKCPTSVLAPMPCPLARWFAATTAANAADAARPTPPCNMTFACAWMSIYKIRQYFAPV